MSRPTLLSEHPLRARRDQALLVMLIVVVWQLYAISSFRMPWQEILVSDHDTGGKTRQIVFSLAVLVSVRWLAMCGSLGTTLGQRLILMGMAVYLSGTVFYSTSPVLTIKRSMVFWFGTLTTLAVVHSLERPATFMQRTLTYMTGILAWVSIGAKFALPPACWSIAERPGLAGVAGHPNTLGPFMGIGLIVALGYSPRHPVERAARPLLIGAMGLALVWAGSMTSILTTAAGVGIFVVLSSRPQLRGWIVTLGFIGGVAFATLIGIVGKDQLFYALGKDPSLTGRDVLWGAVVGEGMKSPIFGSGFGAFWVEGRGREIVGTWNPRQSHNSYIDLFVDLGVLGLIVFFAVILNAVLRGWVLHHGYECTPQRKAVASMIAASCALLFVYGGGESFFCKFDKNPFLDLWWFVALLGNRDTNNLSAEFAGRYV